MLLCHPRCSPRVDDTCAGKRHNTMPHNNERRVNNTESNIFYTFYFTSDDSSMTIILCTLKANTVVTCGFSYSNRVQQMVRTGRQKMRCCVVLYLLFFFSRRRREHLEEDTLLRSELFDGCQILQSIVFPATKNAHTCVRFIGILTYFPVKQLVTHVTFNYFLKKGGRAFHESI